MFPTALKVSNFNPYITMIYAEFQENIQQRKQVQWLSGDGAAAATPTTMASAVGGDGRDASVDEKRRRRQSDGEHFANRWSRIHIFLRDLLDFGDFRHQIRGADFVTCTNIQLLLSNC